MSARCWLIDSAVAYVHKYIYACTLLLVVICQELRKGLVRDRDPPITPSFTRDLPVLLALITGTTTTALHMYAYIKRERLCLTLKGTFAIWVMHDRPMYNKQVKMKEQ